MFVQSLHVREVVMQSSSKKHNTVTQRRGEGHGAKATANAIK